MTQGRIKDPSLSIEFLPCDRHNIPSYPAGTFIIEGSCGKYLYIGINMHKILFGMHIKIIQPFSDRILVIYNIYPVIDYSAGMSDPLTPNHELVFGIIPERIPQAA